MPINAFNKIDNIKNIFNKFKLIQGNIEDIEKGDFSFYSIEKDYEEKLISKDRFTTYCVSSWKYYAVLTVSCVGKNKISMNTNSFCSIL